MKCPDRKPDGAMHHCNTCGIVVWIEGDGLIVADWQCETEYIGVRHHRICYTPNGRAYFWLHRHRIYLDNILRI